MFIAGVNDVKDIRRLGTVNQDLDQDAKAARLQLCDGIDPGE